MSSSISFVGDVSEDMFVFFSRLVPLFVPTPALFLNIKPLRRSELRQTMGYKLQLKATVEGLKDLQPTDTAEDPFEYTFEIQCTSCREQHEKEITINRFEQHEISGSRGEANFVFRCKSCKRESTASITRTKETLSQDDQKPKTILEVEARGLELVKFIPQGNFEATGVESNTPFKEIDLSENEFYDYDDNAGQEVSITEVEWDIVRA